MQNKKEKLKEIYDKLSTPEEKVLDLLESIDRDKLKGDKGDSPTEDELKEIIIPLIPKPIRGKDGKTPTEEEIIAFIKPLIPPAIPGKDGSQITPEEVRDKLKELKGGDKLSVLDLKDLEWLKSKEGMQWSSAGFKVYTDSTLTGDGTFANPLHAIVPPVGVSKIIAGTNVTISPTSGLGDVTVNATTPDLSGYVPYTGATGNVDLNNKQLFNVNKLGIGTATPQNSLDVVVGTAGVMNRGYYETASIERDGDTKFGIYSSQNSSSGYSALTFGSTRYNTGDFYPGWELQFMPGTSLATNKMRINSLGRGVSGVVASVNADIFTLDGVGNTVTAGNATINGWSQCGTYYMNPARTIMMKYDGTYSPRLAFDATFNSDVYGGSAVVDYQEHLTGSAQKSLIFQMGRSGNYGFQIIGLESSYGGNTLENILGSSAFSGTDAGRGWSFSSSDGGNMVFRSTGGEISWVTGSAQSMKLTGSGLWTKVGEWNFDSFGIAGMVRHEGSSTDRSRVFLANNNTTGSQSSTLYWLGDDGTGYGNKQAKWEMGNDLFKDGAQTFYLYDSKNSALKMAFNANGVGFGGVDDMTAPFEVKVGSDHLCQISYNGNDGVQIWSGNLARTQNKTLIFSSTRLVYYYNNMNDGQGCEWYSNGSKVMEVTAGGAMKVPNMPTSDPADGTFTLWYDTSTRQVYMGT